MKTLASLRDDARQTLGPFADDFLRVYAANDDAQAAKASAAAVRDMQINWPSLQWARAQARTGQSKLFYYYFQHSPPAPPDEHYVENLGKDLGAYHSAELAYVFGNFVPHEWAWTQEDHDLARTMSRYWVNFATTGDPTASACQSGRCSIRRPAPCCISARRSSPARSPTKNITRSGIPLLPDGRVRSNQLWSLSHHCGRDELLRRLCFL
jgi:carboxylesterase type B